jgi:hypothetical protein
MPCEKFTEAFSHFFIDKYTASLDALIENSQRALHFILSRIIEVKATHNQTAWLLLVLVGSKILQHTLWCRRWNLQHHKLEI